MTRQEIMERIAAVVHDSVPELADVERYVIPWCPRSRQQALPEGVAPERAAK